MTPKNLAISGKKYYNITRNYALGAASGGLPVPINLRGRVRFPTGGDSVC